MKFTAAVLTISDKGAKGERVDTSGPAICEMLVEAGYEVIYTNIIPDEMEVIKAELVKCSDELKVSLVLTTGGTGFSPRDITPEATLAVVERETRGLPEMMRAASLKITPRGGLSRSVAGIRKRTLIINLPGSKKAAKENLEAVLGAIDHGLEMLASEGSANCGEQTTGAEKNSAVGSAMTAATALVKKEVPSMDAWLKEAKQSSDAGKVGMYLVHNGTVRETAKDLVRNGNTDTKLVVGMQFSYDENKLNQAVKETLGREGIYYVRTWLNEGDLKAGDDIMYVMIGGDIRPRVIDALDFLVGKIKNECVREVEMY